MRSGLVTSFAWLAVAAAVGPAALVAQEAGGPETGAGQFVALKSPINDRSVSRVKNVAIELLAQASDPDRKPTLVIEVPGGTSQFHNIYPLARFLASPEVAGLRTVAWVPETVTGANAILPLACDEIVMHPEAKLGDLGRGGALPEDQAVFVRSIVRKQSNRLLPEAVALGMMDPEVAVLRVQVEPEPGQLETRILTRDQLTALRDDDATIREVQPIKQAGATGLFDGEGARRDGLIVSRLALARGEVGDIYGVPVDGFDLAEADRSTAAKLIKVEGNIDPLLESYLERQVDRAVSGGANVLIFEITSDSGRLFVSRQLAEKIAALSLDEVKTVAYVPRRATSGGAIIALACDELYLGPEAKIGDISWGAADEANQKAAIDTLVALAEQKGRPKAVAVAMADPDLTVYRATDRENAARIWYVSDDEIHETGDLYDRGPAVAGTGQGKRLRLSADRAVELKIATETAVDRDALKNLLRIPVDQTVDAVRKTWVDSLVFFLNDDYVVWGLLFVGMVCLYLDLHLMSGVLTIGGALCFAMFFWAKMLGGTAGSLEVVLFVLGLVLIALEMFVIPGFGVSGISGVLLILASLVMASQTFQGLSTSESVTQAGKTVAQIGGAILGVILVASLMGRFLPKIPLFRALVLAPPGVELDRGSVQLRPDAAADSIAGIAIGMPGKSITTLRPAGKARLGEDLIDVVSEGPYIEPGTRVEVVEVYGNRVVVRAV